MCSDMLAPIACLLVATMAFPAAVAEDRMGDPLPEGAVQRLGTLRMKYNRGLSDIRYLPDGRGVVAVGNRIDIWDLAKGEIGMLQLKLEPVDVPRLLRETVDSMTPVALRRGQSLALETTP